MWEKMFGEAAFAPRFSSSGDLTVSFIRYSLACLKPNLKIVRDVVM